MSRRYSSQRRSSSSSVGWILAVLVVGLFLIIGLCCGAYTLVGKLFDRGTTIGQTPTPEPATLTVAYSPEKEQAFTELVKRFNDQGLETPDGLRMTVEAIQLAPEAMVNAVLTETATFQAMTPDSALWLGQLDAAWNSKFGTDEQQRHRSGRDGALWRQPGSDRHVGRRGPRDGLARSRHRLAGSPGPGAERSQLPLEPPVHQLGQRHARHPGHVLRRLGQDAGLDHRGRPGPDNARLCGRYRKDGPLLRRRGRASPHRAGLAGGTSFPGRLCRPGTDGRLL